MHLQPRGNAMLVGVGGSGKQSLTRFVAHIAGCKVFQIELSRNYGPAEFRADLVKLYRTAGVDNEPVVFLFSDTQILQESFLEDINNMLNSGAQALKLAACGQPALAGITGWLAGVPLLTGCAMRTLVRATDNRPPLTEIGPFLPL